MNANLNPLIALNEVLKPYRLSEHPFYQAWMEGRLTAAELKHYALQYAPFVQAFPRYVSAIHSRCDDAGDRREILQNLLEEEGHGYDKSHPQLWADFAVGTGANEDELRAVAQGLEVGARAQALVDTYFAECRASYAQGLGALLAYESQSAEIASLKIEGLKKHFGISDEQSLAFFRVHAKADVEHTQVCLSLLEKLSPEDRVIALESAAKAGRALWDFLSELHGRARVVN